MRHQLSERVKFLHKVAILRTNHNQQEALILKRNAKSESRPGAWDLPGGNAEWPQDQQGNIADIHKDDISREIKEETNLLIKPEVFSFDHLIYLASYFEADRQVYSIICGWLSTVKESDEAELKISSEHQQLAWVGLAELDNYDFAGERGQFIKSILIRALK